MGSDAAAPPPGRGLTVRRIGGGVDIIGRTLATGRLVASDTMFDLNKKLDT